MHAGRILENTLENSIFENTKEVRLEGELKLQYNFSWEFRWSTESSGAVLTLYTYTLLNQPSNAARVHSSGQGSSLWAREFSLGKGVLFAREQLLALSPLLEDNTSLGICPSTASWLIALQLGLSHCIIQLWSSESGKERKGQFLKEAVRSSQLVLERTKIWESLVKESGR